MTGLGGAVDTQGQAVAGWIGDFLRAPERIDVLQKLLESTARRCDVFVSVSFGGAPWPVESYLGDRGNTPPTGVPNLPPPVDEVWITYGTKGIHWNGDTWRVISTS
jgi:hypothetical protein